jgi:hypothetical protein
LERGDQEEAAASGAQVSRDFPQEPQRDLAAVGTAVERDLPGVDLGPSARDRREVRRVREDPVEATETPRKVPAHEMERDGDAPSPLPGRQEGPRIHVDGHHPRAALRRAERENTGAGADVEYELARTGGRGKRLEQEAVLARRVGLRCDRRGAGRAAE